MINLEPDESIKVLATLEKRVKHSRLATYYIISLSLLTLITLCSAFIFIYSKEHQNRGINEFTLAIKEASEAARSFTNFNRELRGIQDEIQRSGLVPNENRSSFENNIKEAVSIATPYLIFFTAIIFIAYILRLIIIFIKYNMQMTNDYENQRISFLISNGSSAEFKELIRTLRDHNISFEKTPNLPQEKLVHELIELVRTAKK
ncbi:hypothetical protein A3N51_07900 [Enterobacter kobei]|uniref:hypothetical protein n=1 Tax=Enterobacter cloacae complex TaxID=354276 RepID=UPI0007B3C47F|nr:MULTISPECIES: hypothetical protein [Enterobacter cloacae complex]EKS6393785.1 hypothetical protein [Enterobacter hormaechei]KZQ09953.1 hypothetical protein A3N51_07900 [Enterobacter kobei]MCM7697368.1 hypothetical protein [Enterobacter hormaechei]WNJ09017.1 hypothetical protein RIL75_19385 [Enterobacter cloacae]HCR1837813.1 hypothetical protein [Enterobacter kobei]